MNRGTKVRENDSLTPFGRTAVESAVETDSAPKKPVQLSPLALTIAAQYRRETFSPMMLRGIVRIVEFALIFLTGLASLAAYVGREINTLLYYPLIIAGGSVLFVMLMELRGAYQVNILRSASQNLRRLIVSWATVLSLLALAGFLFKASAYYSRGWFLIWAVSAIAALIAWRLIIAWKIRRWARNGTMERRAVIVGGGPNAETLIRALEQQTDNDIRICGIFDDRDDKRSPPIVAGYPKLGTIDELIEFARIARIDMLIVSLPISAEVRVLQLLKKL